jgi:hypothetical protein
VSSGVSGGLDIKILSQSRRCRSTAPGEGHIRGCAAEFLLNVAQTAKIGGRRTGHGADGARVASGRMGFQRPKLEVHGVRQARPCRSLIGRSSRYGIDHKVFDKKALITCKCALVHTNSSGLSGRRTKYG